jgi:hypothetical protein
VMKITGIPLLLFHFLSVYDVADDWFGMHGVIPRAFESVAHTILFFFFFPVSLYNNGSITYFELV